jgi:nucleoid-associated protein YgaU
MIANQGGHVQELVNPYLLTRVPAPIGRIRAAAVALVSVAVAGGCGAATDGAAPPTSLPAPAPAPSPAPSPPPPPPSPPPPSPPASAPSAPRTGSPAAPVPEYTVRKGDTLSGIAVAFKVKGGWPVLYKRNAGVLRDPDLILVGQRLDIDGR